jgi:carboxymethylenebutenolidase
MKKIAMGALVMIGLIACGGPKEEKKADEEKKTDTEAFSELADEEGFAEKHDEPLEIEVYALGEMRKVATANGEDANIYVVEKEGATNYVLVLHEWWGLNNHIIGEADRLYDKLGNVNIIALDLYDGKMATDRETAGKYMQGADENRINDIVMSTINQLPADAKVATIGWCFGGGWSLKTALAAGDKTVATVMYYGMPVEDIEKLKELNSDVLFVWPIQDQWINEEVVTKFTANMKAAEKQLDVLTFDADHAFANPSSEKFIETAAQEANAAALAYLKERLK